jgi:hypothetical protein
LHFSQVWFSCLRCYFVIEGFFYPRRHIIISVILHSIYLPSSLPLIMETSTDKATSTSPFTSVRVPTTTVRMVHAKTQDGNWRTVPLYKASIDVNYRNDNGVQECKILTVHHNNLLDPYYTIRLQNRKEKQTDNTHVMLRLQDGKGCDEDSMAHHYIARQRRAQHAFILQKQRMKKCEWTMKKKFRSPSLPKRKPKF